MEVVFVRARKASSDKIEDLFLSRRGSKGRNLREGHSPQTRHRAKQSEEGS